ncbi:MAG: hypothetical protein AMXMBFR84_01020 [Candidatus Hydrogenedentota bacterium]
MFRLSCICLVAYAVGAALAAAQHTIHVSPDGANGALTTVHAAQEAVRALKKDAPLTQPVQVVIHAGTYPLDQPLAFTPDDSGTADAPVTYVAAPGAKPVLSAGRVITGWREVDGKWVADLPETKNGAWVFSSLWVNGKLRTLARTPNEGFHLTAGKVAGAQDAEGKWTDVAYRAFVFKPGDIQHWEGGGNARVVAIHSWDTSHFRIESIDNATNTVTLAGKTSWPYEHWGPEQRYFVENFPQALDAPGEWYLDTVNGVVTYIPMPGETLDNTTIVAPKLASVVTFSGDAANATHVEHVTLDGLVLKHADHTIGPDGFTNQQAAWSVHGAIQGQGARNVAIKNCEITESGTYGIWFQQQCEDIAIVHNNIHDMGAGGVRIGHMGNDPTVRATIDNNWIHDLGQIYPAAVGVWIGRSSHNTISHNRIHDFYYTGISIGWSWGYDESSANHNVIEYNHVYNLGKGLLSDMGGIYLLGIAPGTTVRNNVFHDIESFYYGGWGIYPDEGSSELLIENNIAYNTKTGGFHQHYGRENIVRNNIFAFSKNAQIMRTREEDHISFRFERNIVYFDNGNLLGSNWKNEKFVINNNCYWDTSGKGFTFANATLDEWRARGHDVNSIIEDPLFINAEARDFSLKPESPAINTIGFAPIDTSKVGLYGEAEWVNAPNGK